MLKYFTNMYIYTLLMVEVSSHVYMLVQTQSSFLYILYFATHTLWWWGESCSWLYDDVYIWASIETFLWKQDRQHFVGVSNILGGIVYKYICT